MSSESYTLVDEEASNIPMSIQTITTNLGQDPLKLTVIPSHYSVGMESAQTTVHVCANIRAYELPDDDNARAPVDIVVALDVSGSMEGDKLKLCKVTLEQLLRMLLPGDRFGLISYDSTAQIDIAAQYMTEENKKMALDKIRALHTRGSTNISDAVYLASKHMHSITNPNAVRSIFLLTDGQANEGISQVDPLVAYTKSCIENKEYDDSRVTVAMTKQPRTVRNRGHSWLQARLPQNTTTSITQQGETKTEVNRGSDTSGTASQQSPISLNCFGYGSDHNSDLLSRMAASATGSYYFVQNDSNVATAFGDALGGVFSVVAQNVTLTIQVPPEGMARGVTIVEVMHKEAIQREEGKFTVTVGDLYSEETRDVLVQVQLSQGSHSSDLTTVDPIPHLSVSLNYTDTVQKRPVRVSPQLCSIHRPAGIAATSPESTHVAVQLTRVLATRAMERSDVYARQNKLSEAKQVLQEIRNNIDQQNEKVQSDELVKMLLRQLCEMESGLSSQALFASEGHGRFRNLIQSMDLQRCAASDMNAQSSVFQTKRKAKFSQKMNKW